MAQAPKGPKRYVCSCPKYCKTARELPRSTYNDHARIMRREAGSNDSQATAVQQISHGAAAARTLPEFDDPIHHDLIRGPGPQRMPSPGPSNANESLPEQRQREAHTDPGSLFDLQREEQQNAVTAANANSAPQVQEDDNDLNNPDPTYSQIDEIRVTQKFINSLQGASIHNGDLSEEAVAALMNPSQESLVFEPGEDDDILLCLRIFLGGTNSAKLYNTTIDACRTRHPEDELLSYDQIKRQIANLTGITPIVKDMCPNSCIGYVGPFSELEACICCGQPRLDPSGKSRQQFHTIPIGPCIQAFKRHSKTAAQMDYFWSHTTKLLEEQMRNGVLEFIDDIACGTDILKAVHEGHIKEHDTVLMLSFDGAQIYRNKQSDCWIYIWIIVCFSPDLRYKKRYVVPGSIWPGPKKIKIVESLLYTGLHHVAAINKEGGLPVWDASRNAVVKSCLYIVLATADGPGMVYLNGLVGHSGKMGCRLWCGLIGRHKPGAPMYYPMLSKPDNYHVAGCDHDDIPVHIIRPIDKDHYNTSLQQVCNARNQTNYQLLRRETGICKPSIFSGLPNNTYLGIPNMFPGDIMHLILNLADLLINLWRGLFECAKTDSVAVWHWAVLTGDVWKTHGKNVAEATPYLPGSFDRPPRNPAEKISSGYKAWEFLLYIFGLGPGLLYGVLPNEYWKSYCKLVAGVRLIYQRCIRTRDQLPLAHKYLISFIAEFETLYIQCRADRLHFARPILHVLSHLANEVLRVGPGIASSQWTMERNIGNLTQEIKQDSTPYANLSKRAIERAEVICLKAMLPELDEQAKKEQNLPRGSINLGNGHVLLRAMDSCARRMSLPEADAFSAYLEGDKACGAENIPAIWSPSVVRWSRLLLPHGQIARSLWKESQKTLENIRTARCVKLHHKGKTEFGDIQYFFRFDITDDITRTLAVISLYSAPDPHLLNISSGTLWSCRHQGDDGLVVVDVKSIEAVVAVVPHSMEMLGEQWVERVFVVEKPGLDVSIMAGVVEEIFDEEDGGE